jgi:catechol 2,3-dioxygenase-like lactoylglutathione lyase family enzyme
MTARFVSTVLHVADVARAAQFYESAFGFRVRLLDELGVYAELSTGETSLALTEQDFAQRHSGPTAGLSGNRPPPPSEVVIAVHDVAAAVARALDAGAKELRAPETKYWGQTVAYVRDLDGHLLQICTPMEIATSQDGTGLE